MSQSFRMKKLAPTALLVTYLAISFAIAKTINFDLLLDINDPCNQLSPIKRFDSNAQSEIFRQSTLTLCHGIYSSEITALLPGFDKCQVSNRFKRDLIDRAIDFVGMGVNALVTGKFAKIGEENSEAIHEKLNLEVREATDKILKMQDVAKSEIIAEIREHSKTANQHYSELIEIADRGNALVFGEERIERSVLASEANLKAMIKYCKKGQVATAEFAELLNYPELADVKPEETTLKSVIFNKEAQTLRIKFEAEINEGIKSWFIDVAFLIETHIMFAIIIILILVILILIYIVHRKTLPPVKNQNSPRPSRERASRSVWTTDTDIEEAASWI